MEYNAPDPHLYGAPAIDPHLYSTPPPTHHHHHPGMHQQQQPLLHPSYPYYPNPNPNPNPDLGPNYDNPVTSAAPADAAYLRPPGVDSYHHDPYAPHGGYQSLAYSYPTAAAAAPAVPTGPYYHGASVGEVQYGVNPLSYGSMQKHVQKPATFEDLETKKRKLLEAGTSADSLRSCSICNIVCNSDATFATHLAGEKHTLKALGVPSNGLVPPVYPTHMKLGKPIWAKNSMTKGLKKAARIIQPVHCEVCKLECNSQDVLNIHKVGKRHKRNLQKLQESIRAKPTNPPTALVANKAKSVSEQTKAPAVPATVVDLQAKKKKILESGAAAVSLRVCTLCNIVCNSQTVFDSHIVGHKHLAMVKQKQQQCPPVS